MPLESTSITHEKMFFVLTKPREDKRITKEMTKNQAYQGRVGDSGKIVGFTPYLLLLFTYSNRENHEAWCANGHKTHM